MCVCFCVCLFVCIVVFDLFCVLFGIVFLMLLVAIKVFFFWLSGCYSVCLCIDLLCEIILCVSLTAAIYYHSYDCCVFLYVFVVVCVCYLLLFVVRVRCVFLPFYLSACVCRKATSKTNPLTLHTFAMD